MELDQNVAVFVSSCDKYEDARESFFALFQKNWECPYQVYLNTETKTYSKDGVITLNFRYPIKGLRVLKRKLKYLLTDDRDL